MAKYKRVKCEKCNYYKKNICTDRVIFVDKKNPKHIVCRYNPNAIEWSK